MAGKARKSTHKKKASTNALARRRSAKPAAPKKRVEIDETKHYEVAEIGPVYIEWGKKKIKNAKGKIVKEYYLKKESKHRIWVKWVDPFQDVLEDDNKGDDCKWSAEPQTVFEGHMKKSIKEALEKKVVWPWVTKEDSEAAAAQKKKLLKSKGFKEWKNAKAKGRETNWTMRYAVDAKTDTSGQSGSDSEGTSSTTDKEGDDDDEDDEV